MFLADMIKTDEDALICDLAETYHIFDYRSLPLKLAATLSVGLRDDSRIKMKMVNTPIDLDSFLLAVIADRVEQFRYGFTEDAQKKRNKPGSIVDALLTPKQSVPTFTTGAELERALNKIRGN